MCSSETEYACRNRDSGEWPPREEDRGAEGDRGGGLDRGGVEDDDARLVAVSPKPLLLLAAAATASALRPAQEGPPPPWCGREEEETAIGLEEVGRGEHGRWSGSSRDGSDADASVRPGSGCIFFLDPAPVGVGGRSAERPCSVSERTELSKERSRARMRCSRQKKTRLPPSLFFFLFPFVRDEVKKSDEKEESKKDVYFFLSSLFLLSCSLFSFARLAFKPTRRASYRSRGRLSREVALVRRRAHERSGVLRARESERDETIIRRLIKMTKAKRSAASPPAGSSSLSRSTFFTRHENVALYVPNLIGELR